MCAWKAASAERQPGGKCFCLQRVYETRVGPMARALGCYTTASALNVINLAREMGSHLYVYVGHSLLPTHCYTATNNTLAWLRHTCAATPFTQAGGPLVAWCADLLPTRVQVLQSEVRLPGGCTALVVQLQAVAELWDQLQAVWDSPSCAVRTVS